MSNNINLSFRNLNQVLRFAKGEAIEKPQSMSRCTAGDFISVVRSNKVIEICRNLAAESDHDKRGKMKQKLTFFCFSASVFNENYRKDENAIASGLAMLDIDNVEDADGLNTQIEADYKYNNVALVHKSPSGHGLHIVYELRDGETIAEGNKRIATALNLPDYDENCKDVSRASFAVCEDYIRYIDWSKLILDYNKLEEQNAMLANLKTVNNKVVAKSETTDVQKETSATPDTTTAIPVTVPTATENNVVNNTTENTATVNTSGNNTTANPATGSTTTKTELPDVVSTEASDYDPELYYDGVRLALIWKHILSDILKVSARPADGKRNNTLFKAACIFSSACEYKVERMKKNIDDKWGLSEGEFNKTLESSINRHQNARDINIVDKIAARIKNGNDMMITNSNESYSMLADLSKFKLPRTMELVLKTVPKQFRNQAIIASLPFFSTLLTGLRYSNDDGSVEVPVLMTYTEGPLASGKSIIGVLKDKILKPILNDEELADAQIEAWQRVCESASSNKEKPMRPVIVKRICEGDFTVPAFNKMCMDARGQSVLIFSEESDTVLRSCGGNIDRISDTWRKGFDGARTGQLRVSTGSVNGSYNAMINISLAGTPSKRRKMFPDCEDGLTSRFIYNTMPDIHGTKEPKYGHLTDEEQNELDQKLIELHQLGLKPVEEIEAINKRLMTKGEIVVSSESKMRNEIFVKLPKLDAAIERFKEDMVQEYDDTGAIASDTFSRRIPKIIRRVGMILWALNEQKEDNNIVKLAIEIGKRTLQELLNRYGKQYDQICLDDANDNASYTRMGHNVKIRQYLNKQFTKEDLVKVRANFGYTSPRNESDDVWHTLNRWEKKHIIKRVGPDLWEKSLTDGTAA